MTEIQDKLNIGVGTKDQDKLAPKKVMIQGVMVEEKTNKAGEVAGDMAIFLVKHPDKEDIIRMQSVKYEKGGTLVEHGTWFNTDSEGLIPKHSTLATFLKHIGAATLKECEGKTVDTVEGKSGYLVLKGY